MIDWENAKPEDFSFQYDVVEIEIIGGTHIFPVSVYSSDGRLAFVKAVPISSEFYNDLRKAKEWKAALNKIVKGRVRDDIVERVQAKQMKIEDKLELLGDKESL